MVTLILSFLPIIPMIVLTVLVGLFLPTLDADTAVEFALLLSILPFLPASIATAIRRLHDLNWKGWWLFLIVFHMLILEIGTHVFEMTGVFYWWMWVFVPPVLACHLFLIFGGFAFYFAKGTKGPNDFGEDPLRSKADD